ncbi:uncharacterized protein LOC144147060 [Haemaphysalis longicornis]
MPSTYAPGDIVYVSGEAKDFLLWLKHHPGSIAMFPFAEPRYQIEVGVPAAHWRTSFDDGVPWLEKTALNQASSLLTTGKVLHVNHDGDAMVLFSDDCVWSIRSSLLQLADRSDACSQGEARCFPGEWNETRLYNFGDGCLIIDLKVTERSLFLACFRGLKYIVEDCVAGGIPIDCEDVIGNRALHYAAHGNQPEIIKFLLSWGADINATNNHSRTALHFASKDDCVNCVRELINHHELLDPNIQDNSGNTPVHVAIVKMNSEIVDELFKLPNVDLTIPNKYGMNCLHTAALRGHGGLVEKILSKESALVNLKQENREWSALHFAADGGHYDIVEALLKQDACIVDVKNQQQDTALLLAARKGHWRVVECLLLAGASINKGDRHGRTALHISLMKGREGQAKCQDLPRSPGMKVVQKKIQHRGHADVDERILVACFLVWSGADIHCHDEAGITPVNLACNLQEPAVDLLAFLSVEKRHVSGGKCKNCLEARASTSFTPCGHTLYCDECGRSMIRCRFCGKLIATRVPAAAGWETLTETSAFKLQVVPASEITMGPGIYRMTRYPRGTCLIINNVEFISTEDQRDGSELDVDRMKDLFTQFLFTVTVGSNLTADEMKKLLRDVSQQESQKDAECLVVILMSHGLEGVIYGSDDEKVHLERDVYERFNNEKCRALQGKPKLFFVQACRGREWDSGTDDVRERPDTPQEECQRSAPTSIQPRGRITTVSDIYIAYATISGYVSIRNARTGSWFLSAVGTVFSEHACTMSLNGLMREVHKKVMECSAHDGSKQTPSIYMEGLTKELYFNPGRFVQ